MVSQETDLKARFDALKPKYGFLWRSMAEKQLKQQHEEVKGTSKQAAAVGSAVSEGKENNPLGTVNAKRIVSTNNGGTSFLDAIQSKVPVSLNLHSCGDDCNCSDPIIELDEDDSVYDEAELIDSDDDAAQRSDANAGEDHCGKQANGKDKMVDASDAEIDLGAVELEDSDEEIFTTGRKKSKAFVIDSEDESQLDGISLEDSVGSNPLSSEQARSNPSDHKKAGQDDASDVSSVSEKEWVELSSDEDIPRLPRVNTVVILSSDDEESESEDEDAHSVFSVSSGDSDESSFFGNDRHNDRRSSVQIGTSGKNNTLDKGRRSGTIDKNRPKTPTKSQLSSKSSSLAFRKKRDTILSSTFSTFNRLAFQNALSSVDVTWSNKLNSTAGITRMKGKLNQPSSRVATIELATKVIDNEERLRSTLLHEMCHAAAWLVDGVHKPPHGVCFKKWANISMNKIKDVEVTTTHDYQIAYKYAWACSSTTCTVVIKRHSRSVDPNKHCCGRCKSKLIEIEVPGSDKDTSKVGHTPKQRKPSAYSLFVKEQTPLQRQRLAKERKCKSNEVLMADVMKECGRLWRSEKNKKDDGCESMSDKLHSMSLNSGSP